MELCKCQDCGYERALRNYSTDDMVRWEACPKCKTFFDHGEKMVSEDSIEKQAEFWDNVERDTGFQKDMARKSIPIEKPVNIEKPVKKKKSNAKSFS